MAFGYFRPRLPTLIAALGLMFSAIAPVASVSIAADAKAVDAAKVSDPATRSAMHAVFTPLAELLSLSFGGGDLGASKNRPAVSRAIHALRDNASQLETHARGKDRAFDFVAKSLARDSRSLARFYQRGDYEEVRFTLANITENCIACHASLPQTRKVPPAKAFLTAINIEALPALERAHYEVMTRQFDAALTTYENYFKSAEIPVADLVMLGAFVDYLKICTSVLADVQRPQAVLVNLIQKPSAPKTTQAQLRRWLQELQQFGTAKIMEKPTAELLPTARGLLTAAKSRMEFLGDRDGLVDYLVAAALLNRYIHGQGSQEVSSVDTAEAYYLLGVTETLVGRSFWVSRQEFDFDTAIRLAPGADFAPKAYSLLEDSLATGLGGGTRYLPEDAKLELAELRGLIEAKGKHKAAATGAERAPATTGKDGGSSSQDEKTGEK